MPNGGSDCCGTCRFNDHNDGQTGHPKKPFHGTIRCTIRDVAIDNSFWTYCANHPHHNSQREETPVGPIYKCQDDSYARTPWHPSPDTPQIRDFLLLTVSQMKDYASWMHSVAIWQLGEFKDSRAVDAFRRILGSDWAKAHLKANTLIALAKVAGKDALPDIEALAASESEIVRGAAAEARNSLNSGPV